MTLPERRARAARAVGYFGLLLGLLSIAMFFVAMRTSLSFWIVSVVFAAATLVAGIVGLVLNRQALVPQPIQPVLALLLGVVLAGGHIFIYWALGQLAHMH